MTDMRILLGFAALLLYTLLLAERGIHTALAPLSAVCGAALFVSLLGSFGLLLAAGWLFYAGALAALGWLVFRFVVQKKPLPRLGYGFWFFALAGLCGILLLWARQPMFTTWDEFSFWGTASKLTKLFNLYYTSAPIGWPWPATYPPGLISLAYLMQFFGSGFSEWQTYATYNLLAFAVVGALLAPYGKKHWTIAFPVALLGFLTPYLFTLYTQPQQITSVYLDSLADVPMGLLFGGALVCYFTEKRRTIRGFVPLCLATAMLSITKDTAFALALVVAVLVLLDLSLAKRERGITLAQKWRGILPRFAAVAASALLPFVGWSLHLKAVAGVSKVDLGGTTNMTIFQMPLVFVQELFSANKSETFTHVLTEMPARFLHSRITLVGSGAVVVGLILLMLVFAALITRTPAQRRRAIVFGVFSTLGFVAYSLLIAMTYIYIFRNEQALELASYERYMYPYYIGWFLAAVCLLGQCAKRSRFVVEGKAALLALCAVCVLRFTVVVPLAYTVIGFHPNAYASRRAFAAEVEALRPRLAPAGRLFLVSSDDDGAKYFTYTYQLLPYQLDYSYGGGEMRVKTSDEAGNQITHTVTLPEWEQYLIQSGCTQVFIDNADQTFIQTFGGLFTDGLQGYLDGKTNLYNIIVTGDTVELQPVQHY